MSTFTIPLQNGPYEYDVPAADEGAPFHRLYLGVSVAPSAGLLAVQIQFPGSDVWVAVPELGAIDLSQVAGVVSVAFTAPLGRIRFVVSGTVGGSGLVAHLHSAQNWFGNGMPDELFTGMRAMTIQGYTEANVKNGVQFEVSSYIPALPSLASVVTLFRTGDKPVAVKARIVGFDGAGVTARVYKNPTYSGGTPVTTFNLSDINPQASTVEVLAGATVTNLGTEFGAPSYMIGSTAPGNQTLGSFGVAGQERDLAPNRVYALELTSTDATDAQRVGAYLSWYEGGLDLPRPQ
jgi:hypothetical protein